MSVKPKSGNYKSRSDARRTLRLVHSGEGYTGSIEWPSDDAETDKSHRTIRRGGLFSELIMPRVDVSTDIESPIFYAIPDILTEAQEAIVFGGGEALAQKSGIPLEELKSLLVEINDLNVHLLMRLKMFFGIIRF